MKYQFSFIGFGEAAYHIAKGLRSEGLKEMIAYDTMQDSGERGKLIRSRAQEIGIPLAASLEEAYQSSDFICSLTSPAVCVKVAQSIIPHLESGQVYVDFNSAAPTDMTAIDQIPRKEGVLFCDVGVLGMVPKGGHRTKMFASGDGAKAFYDAYRQYNTVIRLLDAPAGGASACKMFKSVFSKGFPQLLIESYVPAAAYGVLDQIIDLTKDTFKDRNVEEFADETLYRTLVHAERRAVEAAAAADTVESMGFDASISRATAKKLQQLADCDYKTRIGPEESPNLREVIDMLLRDLRSKTM